jgi:hypothetical protein
MVESMEHSQDVERLFSWLKAPMAHYREFAPQIEVAEAVATWPVVHKAAVQTGVAPDSEPGPHGDVAARERQARDRRFMPVSAAQAIHDMPLPGTEPPHATAGRLADVPAGGVEERPETVAGGGDMPRPGMAQPSREPVEPIMAGFDEPAAAVRPEIGRSPTARPAVAGHRQGVLAGEYREREPQRDPRQGDSGPARPDRSLEAVFSRLSSGGRDRLPDPRERARTTPGLGSVFGRLR